MEADQGGEWQPLMEVERRHWRLACGFILVSQLLERFVFYSVLFNLVFLLTNSPYMWTSVNAVLMVFLFGGLSYFVPIVAGALADTWLGNFKVIVIGYVFYLSTIIFPLMFYNLDHPIFIVKDPSECNTHTTRELTDECGSTAVICTLVAVGIGAGCIRSVMSPFGAQQVEEGCPRRLHHFFLFFYWTVNLGTGLSLLGFSFTEQRWPMQSYLGMFAAIVVSMMIFICGRCFYVVKKPEGSPLKEIFTVLWQACTRRCCKKCSSVEMNPYTTGHERENGNGQVDVTRSVTETEDLHEVRLSDSHSHESMSSVSYRDRAMKRQVTDRVKIFLRVSLIHVSLLVFWITYWQMQSTFLVQGLYMNLSFFHFKVPVAWLSIFDVIGVITCIPVVEYVIFRVMSSLGYTATPRGRMAVGLSFALMSMFAAGLVEHYRLKQFWGNGTDTPQNVKKQWFGDYSNKTYLASPMSIFWQVPQYLLMGIGEALITIAALEYTYNQSPRQYVSLLNGFLWLSACVGGFIGSGIVKACDKLVFKEGAKWGSVNYRVCDEPGCESRLAIYFYSLGCLHVVGIIIFFVITRWVVPSFVPVLVEDSRHPATEQEIPRYYDANSREPPFIG